MALTLVQSVFMTMTFVDEDLDETMRRVQIRWDTDLATTLAAGITHAGYWAAVSESALTDVSFTVQYADAVPSPAAGSENQEIGAVAVSLVTVAPDKLSQRALLKIPSPIDGVKLAATGPQSNIIDTTDAGILALVNRFRTVADGGAEEAFLSHGQDALDVLDGYVYHARSKRG